MAVAGAVPDKGAPVAGAAPEVPAGAGDWGKIRRGPASGFDGKTRPAGVYSGYTWFHLPVSRDKPPELRKAEASRAIFAACMAFSSLVIRS